MGCHYNHRLGREGMVPCQELTVREDDNEEENGGVRQTSVSDCIVRTQDHDHDRTLLCEVE